MWLLERAILSAHRLTDTSDNLLYEVSPLWGNYSPTFMKPRAVLFRPAE